MIAMIDSNENKIGETFYRRAKQLVKQQRAVWTSDEKNAIKFIQDMENIPEDDPTQEQDEEWIFKLAAKRIKDRKLFKWHSIMLIPGLILTWIFGLIISDASHPVNGAFFIGFSWGSWITSYIIHAYFYFKKYPFGGQAAKKARKERELAAEIAAIKSMINT